MATQSSGMGRREASTDCRERLFAVVGRLRGSWLLSTPPSFPLRTAPPPGCSSLGRLTADGLLKGLARVAANEGVADLKSLLNCGCRFVGWQIAACGAVKVDRCWQFRSIRGLSEGGAVVWLGGGDWLSRVAVAGKTPRPSFVYDIAVGEHLLHGRRVSDEQIQAWADEAEAGYDLQQLPRPTPGRPQSGGGPAWL